MEAFWIFVICVHITLFLVFYLISVCVKKYLRSRAEIWAATRAQQMAAAPATVAAMFRARNGSRSTGLRRDPEATTDIYFAPPPSYDDLVKDIKLEPPKSSSSKSDTSVKNNDLPSYIEALKREKTLSESTI